MFASNYSPSNDQLSEGLLLGNSNELNLGLSPVEPPFQQFSASQNPVENLDQIFDSAVTDPTDFLLPNGGVSHFEDISDLKAFSDTAVNEEQNDILRVQKSSVEPPYNTLVNSSPGLTVNMGGWTDNNTYPRLSGDVNGDGFDDLIGFGSTNVYTSFANEDGTFNSPIASQPGLTVNVGGWTDNNTYPRVVGDVNGDGFDDIVGFGSTKIYTSLANEDGTFSESIGSTPSSTNGFTVNVGGWSDNNTYPRMLADVNGDGFDDIVGFGSTNVFVSLSRGDGTFDSPIASQPGLTVNVGGWSDNNTYPRMLADVNGDGFDDIVGFGSTNVFVSLSRGDGTFDSPIASQPGFTVNVGGWSDNNTYPRMLADINGDGFDDIVGFGSTKVYTSLAKEDGTFDSPIASQPGLTVNVGGWTDNNTYPRVVGDVNGDGKDDLIGFGSSDVFVSLSETTETTVTPPPSSSWENPLASGSYTVSQGFHSGHNAIDLAADIGTPIEAARSGTVVLVAIDQYGGKYIDIDHGGGLKTRYLHLSTFSVSQGTQVNDDTKIGEVGNTGLSTGPHLHFEVWQNGVRQNPRDFINF